MLASPITRSTRYLVITLVVVAFVVGTPAALYFIADPERRDLDDSVRAAATGQFVRLTDGYTHYELGGPTDGRTVVLAAGASVPYYIWDPTFDALVRAGFRVLRYDYFGRGLSDRPDIPYNEDLYIRQLNELLDATGLTGPVDLAGLSLGGAIVTSMADRYPDRVRSIIYVDPAFRTPYDAGLAARWPAAWNVLTVLFDERGWAAEQLSDFAQPDRFPDWPDRYRVQMQYRGFRRARRSEIAANADVDQGDEVVRVGEHPRNVLVIWGREDKSVPFELADALLDLMPKAVLLAIDDAGHLPHMEKPDVVNTAMIEFLRK